MLCTLLASLLLAFSTAMSQSRSSLIRLNQMGFYPNAPKVAAVREHTGGIFYVVSPCFTDTVFTGTLSGPRKAAYSPIETSVADFSGVTQEGVYVLLVPGVGYSFPFYIREQAHRELVRMGLKAFYFQRASTPLSYKHAGIWARPMGHPDMEVYVHSSAASPQRPEGTIIASPRGWYDAGDYNKYIVNSGITMGTLLSAYEDFPAFYSKLDINIPETGNGVPDILNESLWNIRWMLTMQDPTDGGVYNKLTNEHFDGMVMPHQATNKRWVVQKGTAAALNFAATMAQAARVYKPFGNVYPGLADSCLAAAVKAWEWAQRNPNMPFDQQLMNQKHLPTIHTGGYGDDSFFDEFIWAGSELVVTTGDDKFLRRIKLLPNDTIPIPAWNQVEILGYYTLIRHKQNLPNSIKKSVERLEKAVVALADKLLSGVYKQPYNTVMGQYASDFIWGSNSVAANQGIALINAYFLTKNKAYIDGALHNLDYLIGRNATGFSFVTGYGFNTTRAPHHRPFEGDLLREPAPGLLAGGPNAGQHDRQYCEYHTTLPDESYVDKICSFASNEIAINWNSPLVYLVGAIEALQEEVGY